jgi:hypothetical protein
MRLLELVEENHAVGPPPHRSGEHAAFLIASIAGTRADQAGAAVLLHELRHVDGDYSLRVVEPETHPDCPMGSLLSPATPASARLS